MRSFETEAFGGDETWKPNLLLPPNDIVMFSSITGDVNKPICDVFSVPELNEDMLQSEEKFWFKPEFIKQFDPMVNFVSKSSFVEKPEWRETRRNSRRQAFFGELTLDIGSTEVTLPVACKHFHGEPELALHEYLASEHINDTNVIKTFEPIGLWFDQNGTAFLLTHFEKDVISLDNVDWLRSPDDSVREHFSILSALERAAYSGARYFANDMSHRDYLAKNVGFDVTTGDIRAIDLEQLRIIHSPENPNIELLRESMQYDLMAFISSIHAAGYRWGESPELRSQILRSTFLSHFRSTLRHPSALTRFRYGDDFSDAVEDVCDYIENLSIEDVDAYWNELIRLELENETE